jgi:hypothetical protein
MATSADNPQASRKMYTNEQTLMVGIIMIFLRGGENAPWDDVSLTGWRLECVL